MSNDKTEIECFVKISPTDNNPIEWMQIIDKNNHDVLLHIPYTPKLKHRIKTFEEAIYKTVVPLPDSLEDDIIKCIDNMYIHYKYLIIPKRLNKNLTLNIEINKVYCSYTQLYFLNKLNLIGFINEIDRNKIHFTKYINS